MVYCDGSPSPENLKNIPSLLGNHFGNISANRWISTENQASRLVEMLQIPAPVRLREILETEHGAAQMTEIYKVCSCLFDDGQISAVMLIVYYMAHHAIGGRGGEQQKNFEMLFFFLGSVEHRAALCAISSMLPMHRSWLAYSNGPSEIVASNVYSTRRLESSVFSRNVLGTIAQ